MSLREEVRKIHEAKELEPWVYVSYRLIGDVHNNTYRLVLRYVRRVYTNGNESEEEYYVRREFVSHKQALAELIATPKKLAPEEVKK